MAKRKKAKPIGQPKGNALAQRLRAYYYRGRKINARAEKTEASTADLKDEFELSLDQAYKTRAFARLYTKDELRELCGARDSHGNPLGWAHVRELFVFKNNEDDKTKRKKLQTQAVENGWTVDELKERIRKVRGGSRKRGGAPFKYTTAKASVADLLRWADEARRYLDGLFRPVDAQSDPSKLVIDGVLSKWHVVDRIQRLKALAERAGQIKKRAEQLEVAAASYAQKRRSVRNK